MPIHTKIIIIGSVVRKKKIGIGVNNFETLSTTSTHLLDLTKIVHKLLRRMINLVLTREPISYHNSLPTTF